MLRLIKTELYKLKRYHILWAGVSLMLLSVLLTLFTSTANDGSVWDFTYLIEQVLKNNFSLIFPMTITLIAGYTIAREQTDDTLKNIVTIPVSYPTLIAAKLIVCGGCALLFGLASALFTIAAEGMIAFPGFSGTLALQALVILPLHCLLLSFAVSPFIVFAARLPNGHLIGAILAFVYGYGGMFASGSMALANLYPPTATLGLIHYRSYDAAVHWNTPFCALSLLAAVLLTVLLVATTKTPAWTKSAKKKKSTPKKGW